MRLLMTQLLTILLPTILLMLADPALVGGQKYKWSAQKVRAWCCAASSFGIDYLRFVQLSVSLLQEM